MFREYKAVLISVAVSLLAFLIFFVALKHVAGTAGPGTALEHRVIQAVFPDEKILLYNKSVPASGLQGHDIAGPVATLDDPFATAECLLQANETGIELDSALLQPAEITVYDDDWYDRVSALRGFRETLYSEGYFGLVHISRPCFNESYDKAVVYLERDCGPECGSGEIVLLHLKDNHWVRMDQRIIWVARAGADGESPAPVTD